jgi:superfamily II DNA or RNA helicase
MGAKLSLGLTATPFRTDRVKLAYEKIIKDCGVRFLIEQGYLSPFNQYALEEFTPQSVSKAFLEDPERWGKSVVYMLNRDLCFETAELLNAGGIPTEVMLGTDSMTRRDEVFTAFEEGKILCLVNIYLLTEGFDAPDLRTCWVRDSCKLPTMQMSGRCLRKDPNNADKVANIVQSMQTHYPYTKTAKARCEFIQQEGVWRQLGESPMIEKIVEMVRNQLWTKQVILPAILEGAGPRFRLDRHGSVRVVARKRQKQGNNFGELFGEEE